jgi:hypothetical protein
VTELTSRTRSLQRKLSRMGSGEGVLCLFCGRVREGGVAGPTPDIYICPDCIRLAAEILDEQDIPLEDRDG